MENKENLLSLIIPVYYNQFNLPDTIPTLVSVLSEMTQFDYEIIFVDDGSGDDSLRLLLEYKQNNPNIKIIKLSKNFGSMAAIQAGLLFAKGDCVGMISADLQDPPELLVEMSDYWLKGNKAVFAIRQNREDGIVNKLFSNLYYELIRKVAIPNYPNGGFDFFLIDRQIVDEINKIQEKNTNLMTLIYWLGFKPIMIPYVRKKRAKGKSRWTLSKKMKLFVDTFVSFTFFPIRIFSVIGLLLALGAFLYGAYIFIYWLIFGISVKGYVPTMLIMTFTGGTQMAMLGILGEYLWRTLDEARNRPIFVIDEIFD